MWRRVYCVIRYVYIKVSLADGMSYRRVRITVRLLLATVFLQRPTKITLFLIPLVCQTNKKSRAGKKWTTKYFI